MTIQKGHRHYKFLEGRHRRLNYRKSLQDFLCRMVKTLLNSGISHCPILNRHIPVAGGLLKTKLFAIRYF